MTRSCYNDGEVKKMIYAYYRVSTETQAEHGGGLETQRQNVERYCVDHGLTIDDEFTDAGISGAIGDVDDDDAINKRAALVEMLATVKDGDTVIVMNTSRLWRSDTAKVLIRRELMRRHVRVIAVENEQFDLYATNPNERFMNGIMELMDEWERLTIALKLAKGRAAKAANGDKPAGVVPYGYRYTRDKKHVEIDEAEAANVRAIFSAAQRGETIRQIAEGLNAQQIMTRRGKSWQAGNVGAILHNRFYVGELQHNDQTITGNHEAIISKIQFGKVAAQLARRRH